MSQKPRRTPKRFAASAASILSVSMLFVACAKMNKGDSQAESPAPAQLTEMNCEEATQSLNDIQSKYNELNESVSASSKKVITTVELMKIANLKPHSDPEFVASNRDKLVAFESEVAVQEAKVAKIADRLALSAGKKLDDCKNNVPFIVPDKEGIELIRKQFVTSYEAMKQDIQTTKSRLN